MLEIVGETLSAGAVIADAYRLLRVVGEGGMGVVWEAREIANNRAVALKFLQEDRESDPRNQERVLREARATMAVRHPNIAQVFAVLETEAGVPFLVMELLEGETLRQRLLRRGALTPSECACILMPVIAAVQAAHEQRIVHRDLKPENIFLKKPKGADTDADADVDADGAAAAAADEVRVLDFGIAKQLPRLDASPLAVSAADVASLTSTGAVLGTPVYMAPEQIFGDDDIDGRADVWSLGIILYECLAGRRPTDGDGFGPIIKRITTGTLEPLERARPGLPTRLNKIVSAMLSRDKSARPNLADVHAVLARIGSSANSDDAPPSERPPTTVKLPAIAPSPSPTTNPDPNATTTGGLVQVKPPALPDRALELPFRKTRLSIAIIGGSLGVLLVVGAMGFAKWQVDALSAAAKERDKPYTPTIPSITIPDLRFDADAAAEEAKDPSHMIMSAQAAVERRDGPACLKEIDAYDASPRRGAYPPSTDPASGIASLRGMCSMLSGECERGKDIFRQWTAKFYAKTHDVVDVDYVELSVDVAVARNCEGDKLSPHDLLLRTDDRLTSVGIGQRVGTRAECKDWYETEKRLLPLVKPRNDSDTIVKGLPSGFEIRVTQCFAHVGDCESALRAYRDGWGKMSPTFPGISAQDREKDMRASFDATVISTCKGKP